MKELFRYPHLTMGDAVIYFDNGDVIRVDGRNMFIIKQHWRYRNGQMQWKSLLSHSWLDDTDPNATIAYKRYITSLILKDNHGPGSEYAHSGNSGDING